MERTNNAPDSSKLLGILSSLSDELEQPYIERRLKKISHKSNPLDELQDAINHINQRENDLQACIGIAKVLAENNDVLMNEKESLENQLKDKNFENKRLVEDISRLTEELEISEEKYKEVNSILDSTQYISTSKKVREEESETISIEKHEADISEIKEKFTKDYENLLRNT
jgi:chromosome segregation ATPase